MVNVDGRTDERTDRNLHAKSLMLKQVWQKLIQGLYWNHMHISRPWRKHVQSLKKISIKLYEELRSQGLYTFIESDIEKWHKVE